MVAWITGESIYTLEETKATNQGPFFPQRDSTSRHISHRRYHQPRACYSAQQSSCKKHEEEREPVKAQTKM